MELTFKEIGEYFKGVKYRGAYYVQLKREVARMLYRHGLNQWDIAKLMGFKSHASVSRVMRKVKRVHPHVLSEAQLNVVEWVRGGLYPITVETEDGSQRYELKTSTNETKVKKSNTELGIVSVRKRKVIVSDRPTSGGEYV